MIRLKLDVSKIDKSRLYRGEKGVYLDVTLLERTDDKYGNDYMAVQDIGKEARERGEKAPILGNGKIFGARAKAAAATPAPVAPPEPANIRDEDIPF